jgi:two-component system cell cycle sensor histidine kinase/response regulator CckA
LGKEKMKVKKKGKLILLCEDENIVRITTKRLLEECGYEVIAAATGNSALSIYTARYKEIEAVILDNILPGLSGYEVFIRMKKINPDIKAVMCSGYDDGADFDEQALHAGFKYLLPKPYTFDQLSEILNQL